MPEIAPVLCSRAGQEALDREEFEEARNLFQQNLASLSGSSSEQPRAVCEFFLGLVAQLAAGKAASPEARDELLRDAIHSYTQAQEFYGDTPEIMGNLARAYSVLGNAKADALFDRAIDLASGSTNKAPLLRGQGEHFSRHRRWKEAAQSYRKALALVPKDDETRKLLFLLLSEHSSADLPEALWQAIEQRQPDAALGGAFIGLRKPEIPREVREALLAATAAALAQQKYDSKELQKLEIFRTLDSLREDPAIRRGIDQLLLLHTETAFSPESYTWWYQGSPYRRSKLEAFRMLIRSLASRPDISAPRSLAYLELAEQLGPQAADPWLYGDLAASYLANSKIEETLERSARWRMNLQNSPHSWQKRDLATFHLRLASSVDQGLSEEKGRFFVEQRLAEAANLAEEAQEPRLLLDIGAFQERLELRNEALTSYRAANRIARQKGMDSESREASERIAEIPPTGGGGSGTGGQGRWGTPSAGTLDCVGAPISGCAITKLEVPVLLPGEHNQWSLASFKSRLTLRCGDDFENHVASHKEVVPLEHISLASHAPSRALQSQHKRLPGGCHRVYFTAPPAWPNSGMWEGNDLLLADAARALLLVYSTDGVLRSIFPDRLGSVARAVPSPEGDPILEIRAGSIVWLDRSRNRKREARIFGRKGEAGVLRSMYDWTLTGKEEIFAIGDLETPNGGWLFGLLRVSLRAQGRVDLLIGMPQDNPRLVLYRMGYPLLARLNNSVYFVDIRKEPFVLYQVQRVQPDDHSVPQAQRVAALEDQLDIVPLQPFLSRHLSHSEFPQIFRALTESSLPVGLYASENNLYLLTRHPSQTSPLKSTVWELSRLGQDGLKVHTVELATTAPHLVTIPGPQFWAFIEKGAVEGWGRQDVYSILFVPTSWINGTDLKAQIDVSPLRRSLSAMTETESSESQGGSLH